MKRLKIILLFSFIVFLILNIQFKSKYSIDDNEIIGIINKYRFDDKTGEIQYNGNEHQLYVKSVGRTNITLWYKYKIFVLDKDIVAN